MNENKKTLTLEEMEKVAGGLVVNDVAAKTYWVVRDDGTVIGPAPDAEHAIDYAKAFSGVSQRIISTDEYKKMFGHDLVW